MIEKYCAMHSPKPAPVLEPTRIWQRRRWTPRWIWNRFEQIPEQHRWIFAFTTEDEDAEGK
jgi:hypothetical protein